jgi:hypothetical protein
LRSLSPFFQDFLINRRWLLLLLLQQLLILLLSATGSRGW